MRSRPPFRSTSQKAPSWHFRDPSTGFHTNDAESGNNKLKKWSRTRYGKLHINASEMDEYVFYVNVGSSMCDVFHGLAMANGGGMQQSTACGRVISGHMQQATAR